MRLQTLHTHRRDLLANLARRMETVRARARPVEWLFPDLTPMADLDAKVPAELDTAARRAWPTARRDEELGARLEALDAALSPSATLHADFQRGELGFLIDSAPVIERIFLEPAEGVFILAQWLLIAARMTGDERADADKLVASLRKVAPDAPPALRGQIIAQRASLATIDAGIATEEAEMNARIYRLYALTPGEIAMVKTG